MCWIVGTESRSRYFAHYSLTFSSSFLTFALRLVWSFCQRMTSWLFCCWGTFHRIEQEILARWPLHSSNRILWLSAQFKLQVACPLMMLFSKLSPGPSSSLSSFEPWFLYNYGWTCSYQLAYRQALHEFTNRNGPPTSSPLFLRLQLIFCLWGFVFHARSTHTHSTFSKDDHTQ